MWCKWISEHPESQKRQTRRQCSFTQDALFYGNHNWLPLGRPAETGCAFPKLLSLWFSLVRSWNTPALCRPEAPSQSTGVFTVRQEPRDVTKGKSKCDRCKEGTSHRDNWEQQGPQARGKVVMEGDPEGLSQWWLVTQQPRPLIQPARAAGFQGRCCCTRLWSCIHHDPVLRLVAWHTRWARLEFHAHPFGICWER